MDMTGFVSSFSSTVKSIVNEDIIRCRRNENMVIYIDELCREIQKMIGSEVEYLGYEVNDKITQVREINKSKVKNKKKKMNSINLLTEPTYARAYNFNFKLTFKGEIRKVSMGIYVPLISDDGVNYLIKGNRYCSPFQIIDSVTYNRVDLKNKFEEVCLKAAIQDIKMQRFKSSIRDINGISYTASRYNIKLNAKINKVPFILFYLASFGFYKTLEYFGLSTPIVGVRKFDSLPSPDSKMYKYYLFFKFGNVYLSVNKKVFEECIHVRDLMCTLLSTKKRSISPETIVKTDFWLMSLGSYLSQSNTLSSGISLRTTFVNSVDVKTSKLIEDFIGKKNLTSTFSVVRWLFHTFSVNVSKDVSLVNKRLRLAEYIIDPLKQVLKRKSYSYSRTRGGYRDIKRLESIFTVQPSIILDAIIGKTANLNTGKFSNSVNDFSIMNSITKSTQLGPGAPSSGKNSHVPKEFKRLHPSMISRLDIINTSINSPGSGSLILPNCNIDPKNLSFRKLFKDEG